MGMSRPWLVFAAQALAVFWVLSLSGCDGSAPAPFFVGWNLEGLPVASDLQRTSEQSGLEPDLVGFYLQWPADPSEPPPASLTLTLADIHAAGALPVLTWEPMFLQNGSESVIPAGDITSGGWDDYLSSMGALLARTGKPVCIRFAHEMNLERYHWGSASEFTASSPALYRSMFQYVVRKVKSAGATNTLWIFCPNCESIPNPSVASAFQWNKIGSWYPGDDVVDIAGLDGYNWGNTRKKVEHGWDSSWRSCSDIFGSGLQELRGTVGSMPIILGEIASTKSGGDREAWIRDAFAFCLRERLSGLLWFQVQKELDWPLTASDDFIFRGGQSGRPSSPKSLSWAEEHLKTTCKRKVIVDGEGKNRKD